MVVAPYCWSAMLGVGRGQGVVLSPILEMATKEAARLENSHLPSLSETPTPKLPESNEDLSGSSLLGVDGGPKIS